MGTRLAPDCISTPLALECATFALGLGFPLPHLHHSGPGLAPATSACTGLRLCGSAVEHGSRCPMPCDVDVSRPIAEGSWHRDFCDASARPKEPSHSEPESAAVPVGMPVGAPSHCASPVKEGFNRAKCEFRHLRRLSIAWRCRVAHARTKLVLTAGCGASSILTRVGCHGASLSRECFHNALDTSGWRLPVRSSQARLGRFELTVVKRGIPASWHPDWHWQLPVTRRARERPVGVAAAWARSGQVRFITRPKSRTMRATRQLMLPPSTVS
jgi:hypothetical protein